MTAVLTVAWTFLLLPTLALWGYESYHDPAKEGLAGQPGQEGYCSECHPGFLGGRSDTLHALHTGGSDPVTTTCNLCHTGSGRDNPLTMWSIDNGGTGLGCAGCHGRDYGEVITNDYRGFTITGLQKNSARGLRRHHLNSGVTRCLECHEDADAYPENVINPGLGNTVHYYLRTDVSLGGLPVDTCINEDSANDADLTGLDNDGDLLYDEADPDCNPDPLLLSVESLLTGNILVSWPAPTPGFVLQENSILGSPSWMDLSAPTQRVMGFWQYQLTPSAQEPKFFRLIQQP